MTSVRLVRRLNETEFKATMAEGAGRVHEDEGPRFDFWPYFDSLPRSEWQGHDFSDGKVSDAYVMPSGRWEHVLVACQDKNVKLVLVIDRDLGVVEGHYLLDLNQVYGLDKEQ